MNTNRLANATEPRQQQMIATMYGVFDTRVLGVKPLDASIGILSEVSCTVGPMDLNFADLPIGGQK